jgi:hypothetical protein
MADKVPLTKRTTYAYEITGPEMMIMLHGSPGQYDEVKLWLYLRA